MLSSGKESGQCSHVGNGPITKLLGREFYSDTFILHGGSEASIYLLGQEISCEVGRGSTRADMCHRCRYQIAVFGVRAAVGNFLMEGASPPW
jgi:hypothetical protein